MAEPTTPISWAMVLDVSADHRRRKREDTRCLPTLAWPNALLAHRDRNGDRLVALVDADRFLFTDAAAIIIIILTAIAAGYTVIVVQF